MWILQEVENGYLNTEQLAQVTVLFNALQPGDAKRRIPNAERAGAPNFLHLLLARDENIYFEIPAWKKLYTDSLPLVDAAVQKRFGTPLKQLTPEQATETIALLETNKLTEAAPELKQNTFFKALLRHCVQGCFADPRWGGNKDKIMWKWYGYQEETREIIS